MLIPTHIGHATTRSILVDTVMQGILND